MESIQNAYFFDITGQWNHFRNILDSDFFHIVLNLRLWNNKLPQNNNEYPLKDTIADHVCTGIYINNEDLRKYTYDDEQNVYYYDDGKIIHYYDNKTSKFYYYDKIHSRSYYYNEYDDYKLTYYEHDKHNKIFYYKFNKDGFQEYYDSNNRIFIFNDMKEKQYHKTLSYYNISEKYYYDKNGIKQYYKPELYNTYNKYIRDIILNDNNKNDKDCLYVQEKLKKCDKYDIYWYCAPADCSSLNVIVTSGLISLYLNKGLDELYILTISPSDDLNNIHFVICNKFINYRTLLKISTDEVTLVNKKDVDENNKIIFFDLIYPLMPYFGYSWSNNKKLEYIITGYCKTVYTYWKDRKYFDYKPTRKFI